MSQLQDYLPPTVAPWEHFEPAADPINDPPVPVFEQAWSKSITGIDVLAEGTLEVTDIEGNPWVYAFGATSVLPYRLNLRIRSIDDWSSTNGDEYAPLTELVVLH